jgi:hypothetical protein
MFKAGLYLYLRIVIIGMKRSTLQQHKEVMMLCEEGMTIIIKAKSAFSLPESTKQVGSPKTQSNTRKTNKHCTNCGMINHNVETCKNKKEQTIVATTKVAQLSQKP